MFFCAKECVCLCVFIFVFACVYLCERECVCVHECVRGVHTQKVYCIRVLQRHTHTHTHTHIHALTNPYTGLASQTVPYQETVDITTQVGAVAEILFKPSKELQHQPLSRVCVYV